MSDSPTAPPRARRVLRNAASPFAARLILSVLNLGYYSAQVRLITNGSLGEYIVAGIILLYAGAITDWGLGTLLTRNLAQARGATGAAPDEAAARRLFGETFGLRLGLAGLGVVALAGLAWPPLGGAVLGGLTPEGSWAILLLGLSLVPGSFSAAASALYYAYERMGWPSAVQLVGGVVNVALGVALLLAGGGIVGLAFAALATTVGTAGLFWWQMRRDFFAPTLAWPQKPRAILASAFPLMINGLLITLFFRFDQVIIKAVRPVGDVTTYENAYKFINFTQIIPPSVTLALFPGLAHAAVHDKAALARQYRAGLKMLLVLALPLVAGTVALAPLLITLLTYGKGGYLPYSAWALQLLIFYLPFSFVNGLTQYVLIALDRQRLLTGAFVVAVLFNLGANVVAVPAYGIYGAAVVTVLTELVLLGPFLWWTAQALGPGVLAPGRGGRLLTLAGVALAVVTGGLLWLDVPGIVAAVAGGVAYGGVLLALRFFTPNEMALFRGLLRRTRG